MGLDLYLNGIITGNNTKHKQMYAIYDACTKANVTVPNEVTEYFGTDELDVKGKKISLGKLYPYINDPMKILIVENATCDINIDLKKLPKDVTLLNLSFSW